MADNKKQTTAELIASIAAMAVVVLYILTFNVQAFEIPSGSMENTLLIGDRSFVDRVTLAPPSGWMPVVPYGEIRRRDIVVFLSPSEPGLHVVKRVIAVPGDRLHLKDGVLYLNGERQEEPYAIHNGSYNAYRDDFPAVLPSGMHHVFPEWRLSLPNYVKDGELVVPPGRYFAMGDNRDLSYDSRYWGLVPRENIIGSPTFIYWSFQAPARQRTKPGLAERLGALLQTMAHFPQQTRWQRMLHMVR
jgi:signal peptidase I